MGCHIKSKILVCKCCKALYFIKRNLVLVDLLVCSQAYQQSNSAVREQSTDKQFLFYDSKRSLLPSETHF
jgi:hypothetical protein